MRGITLQRLSNPEIKKRFNSMKKASNFLGREESYVRNHVRRKSPLLKGYYLDDTWRIIEVDQGLLEKRNGNQVNNGDVTWKIL